jgi:hypothetical protein
MGTLFSRTALMVTVGYVALIAVLLLAAWRGSDLEGRGVALAIIGLPWIFILRRDSVLFYFLVLFLNAATVYVFALSLVRMFGKERN